MSEKNNIITIKELKTYLYSLEGQQEEEKEIQTNMYITKCDNTGKKVKDKEIEKIEKAINAEYKEKIETREKILELLDECSTIPEKMETLEVARYMLYRVNIKKAENVISKATKRLGKKYNQIVEYLEDCLDDFPEFDDIDEIDLSIFKSSGQELKKAQEKYKEEFTEEERKALIQNELDIIEKAKVFNTTPIPHEILKNSDKDIQSKMPKFSNVRQKRLRIMDTMAEDYIKLQVPREIESMIEDALANIEAIEDILTKSEYNSVRNSINRRRKKVYRSTSEIRSIIKSKEKRTGIINYNIQEARYGRMEKLRNIISAATKAINENTFPGVEEQLEKLKASYEREKQFAAVIEKLQEESGINANTEVKAIESQINGLEKRINSSKKIIEEKKEEIAKAKKELLILWKIEIDTTISKKQEALELPETSQNIENTNNTEKNFFFKLKKTNNGKHACA